MAEMQREMQDGERPEDVPAKEIIVLHDPEAEKSLVIIFFDCSRDRLRRRRREAGVFREDIRELSDEAV